MPTRLIDTGARPFLDLTCYARPGPGRRDHFSHTDLEIIGRTVHRTPEVMVKVLTHGGQSLGAVGRHFKYLDRDGKLPIETDDGQRLRGKGGEDLLIEDWDLDLEEDRRTTNLRARGMRKPPKLVHKVLFSMPAGTPPQKVLAAVKGFAREEFGAKHRYAMVLHTDEPHPHVHMVVKAMADDGKRLNIRRDTLRHWRREFARHLGEQGVAANATDRRVRGEVKPQKSDGIHRAAMRGASTHWRQRTAAVAQKLNRTDAKAEPGKVRLQETRREVLRGWRTVVDELVIQNQVELAETVRGFVARMPAVQTETEWIRDRLLERQRVREG